MKNLQLTPFLMVHNQTLPPSDWKQGSDSTLPTSFQHGILQPSQGNKEKKNKRHTLEEEIKLSLFAIDMIVQKILKN